ncbi:MAG: hypothetical protein C4345_03790 [Chloroflexota bacterium]
MPSRGGSTPDLPTPDSRCGLDRTHRAARFGMLMVKEAAGESVQCVAWMWSGMSDQFTDPRGYQCYWKRIARHIGLSEAGKQFELHIYPNAPHAFFNDTAPSYNAEAAADAWQKVLALFRSVLREPAAV